MTAMSAWGAFKPEHHDTPERFLSFLKRCALNCVHNLARKLSRQKRAPPGHHPSPPGHDAQPTAPAWDPVDWLAKAEVVLAVEEALRSLRDEDRWIIRRSYFEGAPLKALAVALGLSSSGAAKRLQRAVSRFGTEFIRLRHGSNQEQAQALSPNACINS